MTNREAIEYLSNKYLVIGSPVNPPKEECEKHNAVIDMAIEALEKSEKQRWIPVMEELPEDYVKVLVTVSGSFDVFEFDNAVEVGGWGCDGWYICDYEEWEKPNVTAWMPFPKSYKART